MKYTIIIIGEFAEMFEKYIINDIKENDYNIDLLAEKYKKQYQFLDFQTICKLWKNKHNTFNKEIEKMLYILYVKFIKRNSASGLGILDKNSKYSNIYFNFIFNDCSFCPLEFPL